MNNKSHSEPNETTYDERARRMSAEERTAIVDGLKEKFQAFVRLVTTKRVTDVEIVNTARDMGAQFELFTGKEKLGPADFNALAPVLAFPESNRNARIEFGKLCVALHQKFEKPLTEADFAVATAECERLMVQLDLLPEATRGTAKAIGNADPFNEIIGDVIKISQDLKKQTEKFPVEQWESFHRQSFLRQAAPFHELYLKMMALEGGK